MPPKKEGNRFMEYLNLQAIFYGYSAQAVIIALISSIIYKIIDKLCKDKLPTSLKIYMPVLFSLLLNCAYEMIFVTKSFSLSADFINKCLLCCSFSSILGASLDRLIKKKPILSSQKLLIEGIVKQFIKPECLDNTINLIDDIMQSTVGEQDKITEISKIISQNCLDSLSEFDLNTLSVEIIKTYVTIDETKTK